MLTLLPPKCPPLRICCLISCLRCLEGRDVWPKEKKKKSKGGKNETWHKEVYAKALPTSFWKAGGKERWGEPQIQQKQIMKVFGAFWIITTNSACFLSLFPFHSKVIDNSFLPLAFLEAFGWPNGLGSKRRWLNTSENKHGDTTKLLIKSPKVGNSG